jgi:1,4-alpha-glucan branching enzyme
MGTELAPEREWNHDRELPWKEAKGDAARIGVARLLDDLAALYHSSPSLWAGDADPGGFAWIDGAGAADPWVVAWVRRGARPGGQEEVTVVVQNGAATARPEYLLGLPVPGRWDELLNTDAASYGGTNVGNSGSVWAEARPSGDHPASARVILPPRGTLFLRPSSG